MAKRVHSKVTKMPQRLRAAIDTAIAKHGATYDQLAAMVEKWIKAGEIKADAAPSRAGLARYGKNFLSRMEQLNAMREQARQIVTSANGDGMVLDEAATNLVLNEIMSIFMARDPLDPKDGITPADVARIAAGLGKLQSSSVQREKLKTDFAQRAAAAAKKVSGMAKKAGLSKQAIAQIEREVLGVVR
jgi:hypothetical protein